MSDVANRTPPSIRICIVFAFIFISQTRVNPLRSIAGRRRLQNSFGCSRETCPSEFHVLPGQPHSVAASVILTAVDAQLILFDPPFAIFLAAHRKALEAAVWTKVIGPMHIVSHFHADELAAALRTA